VSAVRTKEQHSTMVY